jgi:hypothetical protein
MFSCGGVWRWLLLLFCAAGGCSSAGGQLGTLQTQNRSLFEQNRVQLAEIENLKTHSRRLEDKLIEAERQLTALEREDQGNPKRLVSREDGTASSMFEKQPNR